MAAQRGTQCGAADAGEGAGGAGLAGRERPERTAANSVFAALCGRAGVERNCDSDRTERGHGESAPFAGFGPSARRVERNTMNWRQDSSGEGPQMDMEVEQALKHFKASMDAWSDHAMSRPRTAAKLAVRHSWR